MFLVDKFTNKQVDETEMSCKLYISYVTCLVYSLLVYLFIVSSKIKTAPHAVRAVLLRARRFDDGRFDAWS